MFLLLTLLFLFYALFSVVSPVFFVFYNSRVRSLKSKYRKHVFSSLNPLRNKRNGFEPLRTGLGSRRWLVSRTQTRQDWAQDAGQYHVHRRDRTGLKTLVTQLRTLIGRERRNSSSKHFHCLSVQYYLVLYFIPPFISSF